MGENLWNFQLNWNKIQNPYYNQGFITPSQFQKQYLQQNSWNQSGLFSPNIQQGDGDLFYSNNLDYYGSQQYKDAVNKRNLGDSQDMLIKLQNADTDTMNRAQRRLLKRRIDAEQALSDARGDMTKLSKRQQQYIGDDATVQSNVDAAMQQRNTNFSKAGNIMSSISSIGNSLVNADDKKSAEVQQADAAYDQTANAVSQLGPAGALAGGIMKAGGFVSDILTKAGVGTDQMTTADKILDSKFLKLTPFGLVNAIGAKKSDAFSKDEETFNQLDGAYAGTEGAVDSAAGKAGKKYGLFSRRKRNQANREIAEARRQQNLAMNVADQAKTSFQAQQSMTDMYANSSEFQSQGGWNNRMAVGQKGMKLFDKDYIKHIKNSVAKHKAKPTYEEWIKRVPQSRLSNNYDLRMAFQVIPFETLEAWRKATEKDLENGKFHLPSIYELPDGDYVFLKLGKESENPEVILETNTYHSGENGLKGTHDLIFEGDRYYYRKKKSPKFKDGGKVNVIPEGALHARLHHMDIDNSTKKGIPVVVQKEGGEVEQQAEVERNEIIFSLEVTQKLEELCKDGSDEAAIEAGKILVKEILENTVDNTGLINEIDV